MIAETIGLGSVALAAIGLAVLIVRKSARRDELNAKKDERFAQALDKNTVVQNELKIYLVGLNGRGRK